MRQIKKKSYLFIAALLFLFQLSVAIPADAAKGNLTIALSANSVATGDTVTVTLRAADNNNKKATADMVFTYNSEIFSFVSCNAHSYTGGEGGKVSFNGSIVDVKLKAIAPGSTAVKVEGSNGKSQSSGEALDSLVAAGVRIEVSGNAVNNKSSDAGLSGLSVSAGELTPAFDTSVTAYSVTVPYETTALDVSAQTADSKAQIASITGNTELAVGENAVAITVKAENGATAVYQITVIRETESEQSGGEIGNGEDSWQLTRLQEEYKKLDKKYQEEKSFSRKIIAILIFVIIVLVIVGINLILFMKRRNEETDDYVFGESDRVNRKNGSIKGNSGKSDAGKREEIRKTEDYDDIDLEEMGDLKDLEDLEDIDDADDNDWLDNDGDDMEFIDFNKL